MTTVQLFATAATLVLLLGVTPATSTYLENASRALLRRKNVVRASSGSSAQDGTSTAEAFAATSVVKEAKDALATAVATAIANVEGGAEIGAEADASAKAVATAYIKISSNGKAIATVTGDGEACGKFFSSAQSSADVVAEAIAEAFAKSENKFVIGEATTVSEAIKEATLSVEATIRGEACSKGGVSVAVEELIAEQKLEVIASAFVKAFSRVAGEDAKANVQSGASATKNNEGQLSSNGKSTVEGDGTAGTNASASVSVCDTKAKACCDNRNISNGICDCGSGCNGKFNAEKGVFRIKEDDSVFNCKCQ